MKGKKQSFILVMCIGISMHMNLYAQQATNQVTPPNENAPITAMPEDYAVPEIYLAAKNGKLTKVRSLIAEGTDVNASNYNGRTALMSAVFFQNQSIIKELLGEGANVDARDSTGKTALMIAVSTRNIEMVTLLVASGADVTIEDNKENTALIIAEKSNLTRKKKKELMKLLEMAAE